MHVVEVIMLRISRGASWGRQLPASCVVRQQERCWVHDLLPLQQLQHFTCMPVLLWRWLLREGAPSIAQPVGGPQAVARVLWMHIVEVLAANVTCGASWGPQLPASCGICACCLDAATSNKLWCGAAARALLGACVPRRIAAVAFAPFAQPCAPFRAAPGPPSLSRAAVVRQLGLWLHAPRPAPVAVAVSATVAGAISKQPRCWCCAHASTGPPKDNAQKGRQAMLLAKQCVMLLCPFAGC